MGKKGQRKGKVAAAAAGPAPQQTGVVTEATLVRIGKVLEEFRISDAQVHTFEPGLSKQERAAIHEMCRKMGMISKSSGNGQRRRLSVYKTKKQQGPTKKDEDSVTYLKFSEETRNVLRDLFTRYPPDDGELGGDALTNSSSEKVGKVQWKQDNSFCKPSMRKSDIAKKLELLASKVNESAQLKKVMEDRSKLPIASFKDAITSSLEKHQVVLISGETGCGKTTQVPQYILDCMWGKGETCKIVCTQPRRISAISVAERISFERGEPVGEDVGYKIRLESKGGKNSSIMFCTNGVLLRLLIGRGANISKSEVTKRSKEDSIMGITHIIVDEIHERDRFSDFMLAILRDLLPAYPHLHMVLMSATIDAERFSQYFDGCPIIQVPGFTYPVKTFYLEDVLSILKAGDENHLTPMVENDTKDDTPLTEDYRNALDESINLALSTDEFDPLLELISTEQNPKIYNYQHSLTGVSPLMVFAGKGRVGDVCMLLSFGVDASLRDNEGRSALDWAQKENQQEIYEIVKKHTENDASNSAEEEELLNKYLASINPEHIDTVLIERLLRKICTDSDEGAILVFLPGWDDINQTRERLLASPFFRDASEFLILSLHSLIPSSEQKKVFKRPPGGVRKIILSTNIAETAITIDDVVYVIDSGRMKEKSYDPYNNVSTLQSSWISKASARQREGRAGRCQPGTCYHLYSKFRAASLPEYQVKLLDPTCRIANFLQKTLDPPVPETVRNAIIVLQDLGALTQDEQLTDLGEKIGSLPVHPSTSKMLLFAILMNCLDPALTLACAADYRDPFILPMAPDERKKAAMAKVELASLFGGYSDQLAVVAAFECWRRARERGQESQFCSRYFVSSNTMNMLFSMRKQLLSELAKNGFIPQDISNFSLNSQDPGILRAVLMAGLYPMVGKLLPRRKNGKRAIVETASGAKVRLHPHSSNFNLSFNKNCGGPLIIYDEITRGDGGMYIKNCSLVGPYPLLLLAMEMVVAPLEENDEGDDETGDDDDDEGSSDEDGDVAMNADSGPRGEEIMSYPDNTVSVVVDRWLRFESTALDVKNPLAVLPPMLGASMYAIACILSYDGLPTIVPSDDFIESKSDMGEPSKWGGRRVAGYVSPSGFLKSLMSEKPRNNTMHRSSVSAQSLPQPAVQRPFHQEKPFLHGNRAVSATPRIRSFKRQRGSVSR
ncbi:putative ATP-dependent RNA helicase YTHDC2 [Ananas comosus]|uniref:Putative ATP-dependent RNA helicase YTHDC2 n=1 Tax=Ananas comosus TaxID=4615 RepID=A0A199VWR6_ANACO|nr:putative ATP-dependent RNA helicase YTHDC2 [Ananas comosus]